MTISISEISKMQEAIWPSLIEGKYFGVKVFEIFQYFKNEVLGRAHASRRLLILSNRFL